MNLTLNTYRLWTDERFIAAIRLARQIGMSIFPHNVARCLSVAGSEEQHEKLSLFCNSAVDSRQLIG
jgi:hypothetical protein